MLQIDLWKRIVIWGLCALGLLLALPNGFYSRVEGYNDAQKAFELGQEVAADAPSWPSYLPSGVVNLGLDLRGGAHLLAEVQVEDVYAARMKALWPALRDVLRPERAAIGTIRLQPGPTDQIRVKISQPDQMSRAIELANGMAQPIASLTGVGGRDLDVSSEGDILIVTLSDAERVASDERTLR
jgi:preprotein translocase subunit SecD